MTDAVYGRAVGLNMFNSLASAVKLLKASLGNANLDGATYAGIVYEARVQGPNRTEAFWWKLIGVALEMCDLKSPVSTTYTLLMKLSPEDNIDGRARDIHRILDRALQDLNAYVPKDEYVMQDAEWIKRFPDSKTHSYPERDAREKIRQGKFAMKSRLIGDIQECLTLATVYKAYCKRLGPYLGSTTETWAGCDLGLYLVERGINKHDAGQICECLGAIRPEHLAHLQAADMLGQSIPDTARTALIKILNDYRGENKYEADTPIVHKRANAVGGYTLLQMRGLVEAL